MALRIIAVGRMKTTPEAELFARYVRRIRPHLTLTELHDTTSPLSAIAPRDFVIALDQSGASPDSAALASLLERWLGLGRPLAFVIGGADGLDPAVLARADYTLSLGPLTWPHMLARVMLAEQLYRARSIASGHPYHRAARPDLR